ncbi:MAG: DNA polymerase-3 subunit delta [Motiliproteus sp.]|jgi:DNA polymerase-3 subunit delta
MKLKSEQLGNHLKQPLQPVYLLSGDEPLLVLEAGDKFRVAARQQGFSEREVFYADAGFSWEALLQSSQSLSLFSDKQLIELHIPNGKPGTKGADILGKILACPSPDNVIVIYCPKLDAAAQRSGWFKSIDNVGVIIQFWPVETPRLPHWIEQRCQSAGLSIDTAAAQLLADRVEGNLLAAAQEIEKLKLLDVGKPISIEQIIGGVSDSTRYNLFALIDAALEAKSSRSLKILQGLRAEGTDAIALLGSLTWELRKLLELSQNPGSISEMQYKKHRIWGNRKTLVNQALRRLRPTQLSQMLQQCAAIDQAIKGMRPDDPWLLLSALILEFSGKPWDYRAS